MIQTRPNYTTQPDQRPYARGHLASDPRASIYNAPSFADPGTGRTRTKTERVHDDGYLKISQNSEWDLSVRPPTIERITLVVETGNAADSVHVGKHPEGRLRV